MSISIDQSGKPCATWYDSHGHIVADGEVGVKLLLLQETIEKLRARLATAENTLKWYADPKNYDLNWAGNSEVQFNKGECAREALIKATAPKGDK